MRNRFGELFSVTTFGESHGVAIGGVVDGMPAGITIDLDALQREVARRRPGQSNITTARDETDSVEILSGILNGVTLGTPIGFIIRNTDHRSADYGRLADVYRPSHADYTYDAKYGVRDHRGGGRASARETAARVVAGALAKQALASIGITVAAYTSQIYNIALKTPYNNLDLSAVDNNAVRCPDAVVAAEMQAAILRAKQEGDTLGGVVTCVVKGVPAGVGEPVFDRLNARLAHAMMSINAAKAFEIGLGFDFVNHKGSEVIDHFMRKENGAIGTVTNHSGGVQGGISNGEDIYFKVAFKPVATLLQPVATVDRHGNAVTLEMQGRHDPCVVPRAVPIVEAMAAITILDLHLQNQTTHIIKNNNR